MGFGKRSLRQPRRRPGAGKARLTAQTRANAKADRVQAGSGAGLNTTCRCLLLFQERIKGLKNAPIARFDGLGCYQSRSEINEGFQAVNAESAKLARPGHPAGCVCQEGRFVWDGSQAPKNRFKARPWGRKARCGEASLGSLRRCSSLPGCREGIRPICGWRLAAFPMSRARALRGHMLNRLRNRVMQV